MSQQAAARQTLKKALRKVSQRMTATSMVTREAYQTLIQDAANLICTEDCKDYALEELCNLMEAGRKDSSMMDLRALLYVVDKIFKRAEAAQERKRGSDPTAEEMRKTFLPYVKDWIYIYLTCSPRSQASLDKTRGLVNRWREMAYLSVEQLLPLVELLNAPTQDSQSSQTSQGSGRRSSFAQEQGTAPKRPAEGDAAAPQPTRRRVAPGGLPAPGETSLVSKDETKESKEPGEKVKNPEETPETPKKTDENRQNPEETPKRDGNLEDPKTGTSPVQAPQGSPELIEIWPVLGDCRCLFRAVVRSRYLDQCNDIPRSSKGEPLEEQHRIKECNSADKLRALLCKKLRQRKTDVAPLLEDPTIKVEDYIQRMEDWRTWGDEICLKFLPDVIQCPIQVYSLNSQQGSFFDAGMYLPSDKDKQKDACIVLWYNGKSHYDLVSTNWLMAREQAIVEAC